MRKIFGYMAVAAMSAIAFGANAQESALVVKRGEVDTVYKAKHQVLGLAAPQAEVVVNGKAVKAYKTGTWGVELELNAGDNAIEVKSGNETRSFNVYYSTVRKPLTEEQKAAAKAKELKEAEKAKFYPTSL